MRAEVEFSGEVHYSLVGLRDVVGRPNFMGLDEKGHNPCLGAPPVRCAPKAIPVNQLLSHKSVVINVCA